MKQFINIYIISFVLILSQLSLFSSCKDEDTVAELKLDRTAIQIKEGSEGILKIESGSGGYQFSFSEEGYATAKYRENLIYIQGVKYGKVVLNVTDLRKKRCIHCPHFVRTSAAHSNLRWVLPPYY